MRARRLPLVFIVLLMVLPLTPAAAVDPDPGAAPGYQQVVDLHFPVGGQTRYGDSYDDARSGGRVHKAADIMAPEGAPVYAAVGGTVTGLTGVDAAVPRYGYLLRVAGDDGRDYVYVHLGRNDGLPSGAYAPGVVRGTRVDRGQHIGFVGCSGNASCTAPHLHFEIHDERVTDPYDDHRINPYPSLVAAEHRGEVGDGDGRDGDEQRDDDLGPNRTDPFDDIGQSVHRAAIVRLAADGVMDGCAATKFCADQEIARTDLAVVLARALGLAAADRDFFDDDAGLDAEPAINALAAAGIVRGCGDGSGYCPDSAVSRARMASFMARAFALPPADRDVFVDDAGHAHEDNINRLAASGITVGCAEDRFCVRGQVTRGQIASFVVRALDR